MGQKKKKTWEIKKQHIKLFFAGPEQDLAKFEKEINKFFDTLHDFTVEQDWYFPESGFYFVRYMQTHFKKSKKKPKEREIIKE
jgi:hypothetical protein